ncbi:MAG: DUF2141 domain-containing protein [Chitinophagaceae bacterium]|nr:DUF2141 domain-containing protein [Chitinophagaceae bacterium]
MKHLKTISLMLIASTILLSFTVKEQNTFTLTVEIENLRNSKGEVQFALYNTDGSIPDEHYKNYFKIDKSRIESGKAEITFSNLPKGIYAVNILHDENKNGKIDKGFILPKEGIGFSNYSSIGLTNRPNFKKASFELNQNKTIKVKMIYM